MNANGPSFDILYSTLIIENSAIINACPSVFDDNISNTIRILPPPTMNGSKERVIESCEGIFPESTKPKQKIPRPPNAFILYRQHFHPSMKKQFPDLHNNELCMKTYRSARFYKANYAAVIIGNKWKAEEQAVKQKFKDKAEEKKKAHVLKYPNYQYQPRKANEKKRRMTKRKAALLKAQSTGNDFSESTKTPMLELPEFDSQSARNELNAYVLTLKNQIEQYKKPIISRPDGNNGFTIQLGEISPERANFLRDLNEKITTSNSESNRPDNDYLVHSISETPVTAFDDDLCRITSDRFMGNKTSNIFDEDEEHDEVLESYTPNVRGPRCVQDLVYGPYDISEFLHSDPYVNARVEEFANLERQRQIASEITLNAVNSSNMVDDIYENERAENPQVFDPIFEHQGTVSSSGQVSATNTTETFNSLSYNGSPATQASINASSTTVHGNIILDPELALLDNNVSNGTADALPSSSAAVGNSSAGPQPAINIPQAQHPIAITQNPVVGPDEMSELESMLLELQAEADDQEQGIEVADFNALFVDGVPVPPISNGFGAYEHM